MAEFEYSAVSHDEFKTGRISAESQNDAETVLGEQGLTVISLNNVKTINLGFLNNYIEKINASFQERMSVSERRSSLASGLKVK